MNLTKKFLNESKRRFLIRTSCDIFLKEFVNDILYHYKKYGVRYCESLSEFMEVFGRGELFDYTPQVIVLANLKKDDVKPVLDLFKMKTEDILIFVERNALLRSKEYTYLKADCHFFEFKDPDTRSCGVRARRWLNGLGLKFMDDVPSYIVQKKGPDLDAIYNEIQKLSLIAKDEDITLSICDKVISDISEAKMFDFMDLFFRKRMQEMIEEFKKVPEGMYVKFLHFIIGQLERIYKVAVYKEQGLSAADISEMIGIPSFIIKTKLFTATAFYSKIKLIQVVDLFNILDLELRTSKYPKGLLFETYLVKAIKL